MQDVAYLLAAVVGKMLDPLIVVAGVAPALLVRRWLSLLIAVVLGCGLGLFVYVMSARVGYPVSVATLPVCAAASAAWWSITVLARRVLTRRNAKS